jgi:hypothetical protein
MTHDILQSDIELAIRLRSEQYPDEQIIQALTQRRVDPVKAAQLLDDLRNGRDVKSQSSLPQELGFARRSRSRSGARRTGGSPSFRSKEPDSQPERRTPQTSSRQKKSPTFWVVLASLVMLVLGLIGFALVKRAQAGSDATEEPTPKAASGKGDRVARENAPAAKSASKGLPSAPLALDLRPDGLHIGSTRVTPGTVLVAVANSLGTPTRTNRVGQTGTVIYAYDQHGLLIYSQPGGGTNSIILDCEANGGTHGTTSPFAGNLTVEGKVIRADTDPQTLTAIKPLALGHPGADSSIWGGRYNDLQLVFAYLKSPRRLSLIEIDLK